jgi:uncharacterized protein YbjQ (UPF0145 family)
MPWPGRRPEPPSAAVQEAQERSRRQIEAGGLPVAAEQRLQELAQSPGGLFTSDLSVNEFALLDRHGIEPITQVMGSSIFQHGWQNLPYGRGRWGGSGWTPAGGGGWTQELTNISDAFNHSRTRALSRLRAEAQLAGADAVVGVRVSRTGHGFAGADTVEFSAVGTAVRLPAPLRTGGVVITDLSGQEYVQLARAGYRPVGVVGATTVMYVAAGWNQNWVMASSGNPFALGGGMVNQELRDFTHGFYDAREVALWHLNEQARALHADGIVGVSFEQSIQEREYEVAGRGPQHDLIVSIHLLGTAITEGHTPLAMPHVSTVMHVGAGHS